MKKAASAALTTGAAVANGMELAGQVSATAAEMLRTRRDPAVQARKKRRAAKRRLAAWSAGAVAMLCAVSLLVYCALIFPFLKSFGTLAINAVVLVMAAIRAWSTS